MNNRQYPKAIEKQRANLAEASGKQKMQIRGKLQEARALLKKNPDLARAKAAEAQEDVRALQAAVQQFEKEVADFDQARLSHEGKIREADKAISDASSSLSILSQRGYLGLFRGLDHAAAERETALRILYAKDDVPDYRLVVKHADEAVAKAESAKNKCLKRCELQSGNDIDLGGARAWLLTTLPHMRDSCQVTLNVLKVKTPPEVWEPAVKEVERSETAAAELNNSINEADNLNGMEKQEFERAGALVEKIQSLRLSIQTALSQPEKTLRDFTEAQAKAKSLASQAAGAVSQAKSAVSDSDAEGAGSNKLREAEAKIREAKNLEEHDLINWFLVAGLLAGAIVLAQSAEHNAKSRSDEVESARRRIQNDAYHHSSGSSWSSGGGGGGFGGFGGGSFGGGGASGRW